MQHGPCGLSCVRLSECPGGCLVRGPVLGSQRSWWSAGDSNPGRRVRPNCVRLYPLDRLRTLTASVPHTTIAVSRFSECGCRSRAGLPSEHPMRCALVGVICEDGPAVVVHHCRASWPERPAPESNRPLSCAPEDSNF